MLCNTIDYNAGFESNVTLATMAENQKLLCRTHCADFCYVTINYF